MNIFVHTYVEIMVKWYLIFLPCYLICSRDELVAYQKEAKRFLYIVVTFRIFILIGRKVYCVIKHIRK